MAGWSIYVCPKCHVLGKEHEVCPSGCKRAKSVEEAVKYGGQPFEECSILCIGIDVVPTELGSIALVNASTAYLIV